MATFEDWKRKRSGQEQNDDIEEKNTKIKKLLNLSEDELYGMGYGGVMNSTEKEGLLFNDVAVAISDLLYFGKDGKAWKYTPNKLQKLSDMLTEAGYPWYPNGKSMVHPKILEGIEDALFDKAIQGIKDGKVPSKMYKK